MTEYTHKTYSVGVIGLPGDITDEDALKSIQAFRDASAASYNIVHAHAEGRAYDWETGEEVSMEEYEAHQDAYRKQYWRRTKEWAERLWEDLRDW